MRTRRRPKYEFKPHHYLARQLSKYLNEHNPPLSIKDAAEMMRCSQESLRRVVSDCKTTSERLVEDFADALKLSDEQLEELLDMSMLDKFEQDYGPYININKTSIPASVSMAWEKLTSAQKKQVGSLVEELVTSNLPPLKEVEQRRFVKRNRG